jgi:Outer membrane protein beta-barrel domain
MPGNSLKIAALLLLLTTSVPAAGQSAPAAAPAGSAAPAAAFGPGVFIYPKNGQTQQQLWSDRYACDNWSKTQSGFDPARADGAATPGEVATRREQYRQAMTACLGARGYSIGAAPPAAAPAQPAAAPSTPALAPAAAPAAVVAVPRYASWQPELTYHPLSVQLEAGYTLTEGDLRQAIDSRGNVGLGIHWFPSSWLPLGLRVDGSYSQFRETDASVNAAAAALGTDVTFGHQDMYGGDADLQLDLAHRSTRAKLYVFGGFGWYRQTTVFKQQGLQGPYLFCGYYSCGYGYLPVVSTVSHETTPWEHSWNAGFGAEFAVSRGASFFIEARYLRLAPYDANNGLVPIDIGLRF